MLSFSQVHMGCKSTQDDLDEFFHHENHKHAELTDYSKIPKLSP